MVSHARTSASSVRLSGAAISRTLGRTLALSTESTTPPHRSAEIHRSRFGDRNGPTGPGNVPGSHHCCFCDCCVCQKRSFLHTPVGHCERVLDRWRSQVEILARGQVFRVFNSTCPGVVRCSNAVITSPIPPAAGARMPAIWRNQAAWPTAWQADQSRPKNGSAVFDAGGEVVGPYEELVPGVHREADMVHPGPERCERLSWWGCVR